MTTGPNQNPALADNQFQRKKLRNAELIMPPNKLKEKVGNGGLDAKIISRAQDLIESNTEDFRPIAATLIDMLETELIKTQSGQLKGEAAIEAIIYPAMQLKAQGAMFKYPLITDISGTLVGFLEVIRDCNKDALDIVIAHKMAIKAVLRAQIKGDGGAQGTALREELREACVRYFQLYKESPV